MTHPWRHSPEWGLPSRCRCPQHRWGRSARTLTWRRLVPETRKVRWRGGQNPVGGCGGHIGGCQATRDPPHGITGAWPIWEPVTGKNDSSLRIWNLTWIKKTDLPVMRRGMGWRGHPERWDAEPVVVDHMESRHTAWTMLISSYSVKEFLKLDKL
jgi:hypothetical protein